MSTPDPQGSQPVSLAFAPETVQSGAVLPEDAILRLLWLGDGWEDTSPFSAALALEGDGWAVAGIPVLVRGNARIIPLAWWGDPKHGGSGVPSADPARIEDFALRVQDAGVQLAGSWHTLPDLEGRANGNDSVGSYAGALRSAGVLGVNAWRVSDTTGLVLARAGSVEAGTASLALHLVPVSWVAELPVPVSRRQARAWRPVTGLDLSWSWTDVVALAASRTSTASDESRADDEARSDDEHGNREQ